MTDFNMEMARLWAYQAEAQVYNRRWIPQFKDMDDFTPCYSFLPQSLDDLQKRAELVQALDVPELANCLAADCKGNLDEDTWKECLSMINDLARPFTLDMTHPIDRVIIALRLWAGCISGAKVIALETRNGPNTPWRRKKGAMSIDRRCVNDPIFQAGAEAAPAFKRLRGEPYSFRGSSMSSVIRTETLTGKISKTVTKAVSRVFSESDRTNTPD